MSSYVVYTVSSKTNMTLFKRPGMMSLVILMICMKITWPLSHLTSSDQIYQILDDAVLIVDWDNFTYFRVDRDPAVLRLSRAPRQTVGQVPAERPRHPSRPRQVRREHDEGEHLIAHRAHQYWGGRIGTLRLLELVKIGCVKYPLVPNFLLQVKMGGSKDGGTSSPEPDHDQSAPQDEVRELYFITF